MNDRFRMLLIASSVLVLTSMVEAADDWQYWNQFVFKHDLTDKLALDVASEQKWLDDMSDFYLYNVTVVPTVSVAENVSLGAGYRCEREEKDDDWFTENRFLFPLTIGWTMKPWSLQLRTQPEYRDLEDTQDRWRIRERIMLKWPVHIGGLAVTPFIAEEVFYDFTVEQTNQNRAAVGLSVPWGKHTTLSVFYLNKAVHDEDWSTTNVLGTEVAFKF